jgi:hypothetical protein
MSHFPHGIQFLIIAERAVEAKHFKTVTSFSKFGA